MPTTTLTGENLEKEIARIKKAAEFYGLDFFEVIFHTIGFEDMHELAAYGGFPNRYPHFRWAVEYEKLSKAYQYGLAKIYEMVVNTDPCHAYLLSANLPIDTKIVIAHVFGHADFFKNNYCFSHTDRHMLDEIANHCARIERHIDKLGQDKVENFITRAFSLENLIDLHSPFIERRAREAVAKTNGEGTDIPRLKAWRSYLEPFLNPTEWQEEMKEILKMQEERKKEARIGLKIPEEPERDILLFLLLRAPLEDWEKDILSIVREEHYYFAPQGQTKIMNEGWATYWHSRMLTGGENHKKGEPVIAADEEIVDYAKHHSGTVASNRSLNPYRLGLAIWKDIEERWNKGKFGPEWEDCLKNGTYKDQRDFNKKLGHGREKMFEVRRLYNDVNFLSEFLTDELLREQKLFHYQKFDEYYLIDSVKARKIKKTLLFQLTNFGDPIIKLEDANYKNQGEIYLKHYWEGVPLDLEWAREVLLRSLSKVWRRPVNVETVIIEEEELPSPPIDPEKPLEFQDFPEEVEGRVLVLRCTPDGEITEEEDSSKTVKTKALV